VFSLGVGVGIHRPLVALLLSILVVIVCHLLVLLSLSIGVDVVHCLLLLPSVITPPSPPVSSGSQAGLLEISQEPYKALRS
jgi:hypothetical protein